MSAPDPMDPNRDTSTAESAPDQQRNEPEEEPRTGAANRLYDRLRAVVDGLPSDAAITLPVSRIQEWLSDAAEADAVGQSTRHLTTRDAAERLGVQPATVASWCADGRIPDAWKTGGGNGGEWRIPESALSEVRPRKEASVAGDRMRFDRKG